MADVEILPGNLPFSEAVGYLRGKVDVPSRAWTDLKEAAHTRAFTVAGATSMDLVADFRASVDRALQEGRTLADFRQDFDRIVAAHGWSYKGARGWRSAVIFNTNMRMARSAGRWAQARRLADAEGRRGRTIYLRYRAVLDERTRDQHRAWHDIVLPIEHSFWKSHFPPNGWNCRCSTQVLTERGLRRRGLRVTPDADLPPIGMEPRQVKTPMGPETWPTPAGIDTGFGYNPGDAWMRGVAPPPLDDSLPSGPWNPAAPANRPALSPRPVPAERILPEGLSEEAYVDAFLGEFGGARGRTVAFRDAAGFQIAIDEELFVDSARSAAEGRRVYKVMKRDRARYVRLLADAVRDPDEIWLDWVALKRGPALRRRYVKAFDLPDRAGGVTIFEWTNEGWVGVTSFPPDREAQLDKRRQGMLLYRRLQR